jgi:hypothetical protein
MPTLDLMALARLRAKLRDLSAPRPGALMIAWMKIIDDDNRWGVMAGLDKDGVPMDPVKYRPRPTLPIARLTAAQKNTANKKARRGAFRGFGPAAAGLNNNLTSTEYSHLAGPPLAPRGAFSRVITNLKTRWGWVSEGKWEAVGYWDEVVSTRGVPFLAAHFRGRNRLPRRDLRGVRPEGKQKAVRALRAWALDLLRSRS